MSNTPRTDSMRGFHGLDTAVDAEFSEQLECELAVAQQRIKRLEEVGRELRECASQLGWTSSEEPRWLKRAEAAVETWDKEAKL